MSLKIRRLQINVQTSDGPYGTELVLEDGLNILHAENSMGKSTCVQAIIYALGLERMLGPTSDVPLTPAVTAMLEDDSGEHIVLESEVLLEIENNKQECLTIRRPVKGSQDTRLVTVWNGAKISLPNSLPKSQDYSLRDPGSATRDAGFHHLLSQFLDYSLPNVSRNNGSTGVLYLEGIFPLFFVEQEHGWAGIQANLPTYLGIRELAKRALEFVLALDAANIESKRQKIEQEQTDITSRWKQYFNELQVAIQDIPARNTGLPREPQAAWPPTIAPSLEVLKASKWINWNDALQETSNELSAIKLAEIPSAGAAADEAFQELNAALANLNNLEKVAQLTLLDLEGERAQLLSVETRIIALEEDLRRNSDVEKLRKLGSIKSWDVAHDTCPTCHQHLEDTLLPQNGIQEVMAVGANIELIRNQLDTFKKLRAASNELVYNKTLRLDALRNEISTNQAQIRALKQTLTSANSSPAASVIRRQLELEIYQSKLLRLEESFTQALEKYADLAERWSSVLAEKLRLPSDGLSISDKHKLNVLEGLVREQLIEYGFRSIPADTVSISPDNYRPTREGFNLGFDLSASDNIRIIWSYLTGLLELARAQDFSTNHAGILIFDEPRQQEAKEISFAKLLRRAALSKKFNQQVIFATSENLSKLQDMTAGLDVKILDFEGRILKRRS